MQLLAFLHVRNHAPDGLLANVKPPILTIQAIPTKYCLAILALGFLVVAEGKIIFHARFKSSIKLIRFNSSHF